jgi:hypothetical protein
VGESMTEDQEQIKAEVETKGITRLCHFTQARKLPHILTTLGGLWSVQYLTENAPDLLDYVDRNRFDGRLDHICCSIEYPNTWYLDRVRYQDPNFRDWIILFLSRTLIWKEGSLFSRRLSGLHGTVCTSCGRYWGKCLASNKDNVNRLSN